MDPEIIKRASDALRFSTYLQFHSVKDYLKELELTLMIDIIIINSYLK